MTEEKIYTNLSFGFEIEVMGKCRKLPDKELAKLHSTIKSKLLDYIMAFHMKGWPDFELNEVGELLDYEQKWQVE